MTNILQSYAPFNLLLDVVEKEQQRYILQEKRKIQENGLEKVSFWLSWPTSGNPISGIFRLFLRETYKR